MFFAGQSGLFALIRLLLCLGESGHPRMLGIPPHLKCWFPSMLYAWLIYLVFLH